MEVKPITRKDSEYFILHIHYAKRFPSISYYFGLFDGEELIGICTYGTPASSGLRKGIAGKNNIDKVIELNRLCLKYNRKNEASYLVANSLKLLPKNKIIVSFADTEQNHLGIVYQATNFLYTGLSAKRTNWVIEGLEHLHGQTIADKYRRVPNRVKVIRAEYGDKFKLVDRPRKHRYIYITGSKTQRKKLKQQLLYKIQEYPKGENNG